MARVIAGISTGQAEGGIGMVRLSGEGCTDIADRVFECPRALSGAMGYTAHHGYVHDNTGWRDEAVAIVYRAPKSYTGEDTVELCCHGGLAVTRMTLNAVLDAGAVMAEPGEFTRRAFENGKMSLTQAESVMSIISAQGRQAALAAQAAHDGVLDKRIGETVETLTELSVKLSAWCDYPDEEDIPEVTAEQLINGLQKASDMMAKLIDGAEAGRLIREGIDTVICGKPNVGKSTLMNLLAGCERSIVTDIPGTTRDIVEERISLGDCILRLSDTAGLRETLDSIERIGVERASKRIDQCALVLAVFDGSEKLDSDDAALIDKLADKPCVAVINKSDKETIIDVEYIRNKIQHIVLLSAKIGNGVEQLAQEVKEVTKLSNLDPAAGILINVRQTECVKNAAKVTQEALEAVRNGMTFDAVNVLINDSISHLLELTGERATDHVVDRIFAQFCVGK